MPLDFVDSPGLKKNDESDEVIDTVVVKNNFEKKGGPEQPQPLIGDVST